MRTSTAVLGVMVALSWTSLGCQSATPSSAGTDPSPSPSTPSASADPSPPAADPTAEPTIEGLFAVTADGRELALTCWGEGAPTVVLDPGSLDAGIARWSSSAVVSDLAQDHQVCAYDRAGLGSSDQPPHRPRVLDDVTKDLHALLIAAGVRRPVVLVGSSGGGFDVFHHAGRYPRDVAGLVMLDVPAGQARMSHADGPPEWDSVDNPENVDYYAEEHQMATARLPIASIPVTVVTAESGQSADPDEQRVWLVGSSRPVQVVLAGGHSIAFDDPEGVLKEIRAVLDVSSSS